MSTTPLFSVDEINGNGSGSGTAPAAPMPSTGLFSADEISTAGGTDSSPTDAGEQFKSQAWKDAGQKLMSGDLGGALDSIGSLFTGKNPAAVQAASQLKDAAIGAGKQVAKGAANVGDIATLGATHLLPGSAAASGGIGATGTALNPTNDDQRYGSYVGDAATFELGSGIMDSLAHLPLADRMIQAAKAMKVAQEHPVIAQIAANAVKSGATAGAGTLVTTGDPTEAAKGAATGAIAGPVVEGVANVASKAAGAVSDYAAKVGSGLANIATDIPGETESKLVDAIGDSAENNGFERSDADTLKDAVSDLSDNFKNRAQNVYQQLDAEAPGFQELRDKIQQLKTAYKTQLNIDPAKADEIGGALKEAQSNMDGLLDEGQTARWQQADQDWSRYKALQQVQGKANRAASDLTSDELQDVNTLHSGVRSLTNATRKGSPIDILSKAFGDDAGNIRQIVQDGANLKGNTQAAKLFLKWAAPAVGLGYGAVKGAGKLSDALSKK